MLRNMNPSLTSSLSDIIGCTNINKVVSISVGRLPTQSFTIHHKRVDDETRRHGLPSNRKPRFEWTSELHQNFVEAVRQLGGAYKATPRNIIKLIGIPGITLSHLKSHLQRYRKSKIFCRESDTENSNDATGVRILEANKSRMCNIILGYDAYERRLQVNKDPRMEIEVQGGLHLELENAKGNYLFPILKKTNKTGREYMISEMPTDKEDQHSQLSSDTPPGCLDSSFLSQVKGQMFQPLEGLMEKRLNLHKGSPKNQNIHLDTVDLASDENHAPLCPHESEKHHILEQTNVRNRYVWPSEMSRETIIPHVDTISDDLTISIGLGAKLISGSSTFSKNGAKQSNPCSTLNRVATSEAQQQGEKSTLSKLPCLREIFDLNACDKSNSAL